MAEPLITLLTDFGDEAGYVAQMKAVALSINRSVQLVDLCHSITPQSIAEAAFVWAKSAPLFPCGTIHVAVIDPGVGTNRRILLAQIDRHFYIAPDNGLLSLLIRDAGSVHVRSLNNPTFFRATVSTTFHGRDVMAPVAAHLTRGVAPEELGVTVEDPVTVSWPIPTRQDDLIRGQVIFIDRFGNLITNVEIDDIRGAFHGDVSIGGTQIRGISRRYADGALGEALALIGSSGHLEIAISGGHAAARLGAKVGDEIVIRL